MFAIYKLEQGIKILFFRLAYGTKSFILKLIPLGILTMPLWQVPLL
jgi:hypothetical protein